MIDWMAIAIGALIGCALGGWSKASDAKCRAFISRVLSVVCLF